MGDKLATRIPDQLCQKEQNIVLRNIWSHKWTFDWCSSWHLISPPDYLVHTTFPQRERIYCKHLYWHVGCCKVMLGLSVGAYFLHWCPCLYVPIRVCSIMEFHNCTEEHRITFCPILPPSLSVRFCPNWPIYPNLYRLHVQHAALVIHCTVHTF